jgi:hypothetical protein
LIEYRSRQTKTVLTSPEALPNTGRRPA